MTTLAPQHPTPVTAAEHPMPASAGRAQTLTHVIRAESGRLHRTGGLRGALITATLGGVGAGWLGYVFSSWMAENVGSISDELVSASEVAAMPGWTSIVSGVEVGAFVAAVLLSIAVVFHVARDHARQLGATLQLVPHRGRLVGGQLATLAMTSFAVLGVVSVTTAALASAVSGELHLGAAAVSVGLTTVAGTAMVVFAAGLTMCVRSVAAAILSFIGVVGLLPLGVLVAGLLLPAQIGRVLTTVAEWLPTALYFRSSGLSLQQPLDQALTLGTVAGMLGLLAALVGWAVLAWVAARAAIARREP
ncbi:MAG: hypothetical protein Q4G34_01660 [Micrococcus sp.]|nr:hypothetical protein [Micrococcus sp.]